MAQTSRATPMGSKQHREARRAAYANANRTKLFKQGQDSLYKKLGVRLKAFFSKEAKAEYEKMLSWWYKRSIKKQAHEAYKIMHDPEVQSFQKARSKVRKEYMAKKGAKHG